LLAHESLSVTTRDLVKQPLTLAELRALARRAGGPRELVAPKQRAAAADLDGEPLLAWLAADGRRVRRPIIDLGGTLYLGFAADVKAKLTGAR